MSTGHTPATQAPQWRSSGSRGLVSQLQGWGERDSAWMTELEEAASSGVPASGSLGKRKEKQRAHGGKDPAFLQQPRKAGHRDRAETHSHQHGSVPCLF